MVLVKKLIMISSTLMYMSRLLWKKFMGPCQGYGTCVLFLSPHVVNLVDKVAILCGVMIYAPAIHYTTICSWEILEIASLPNLNRMDK